MLTNIVPTKTRSTGIKTYAGNKSFFATHNFQKVKVYEPFNDAQKELRLYIDKHEISRYFPKVVGVEDNLIIEEFIVATEPVLKSKVIEFHNQLLNVPYTIMTWDYFDYIYNRVNLEKPNFNLPLKVNHNDLTIENILSVDGQIKIVDNEMLAMNDAWVLNYLNSNILDDKLIHGVPVHEIWQVRKSWKK